MEREGGVPRADRPQGRATDPFGLRHAVDQRAQRGRRQEEPAQAEEDQGQGEHDPEAQVGRGEATVSDGEVSSVHAAGMPDGVGRCHHLG